MNRKEIFEVADQIVSLLKQETDDIVEARAILMAARAALVATKDGIKVQNDEFLP